VQNFQNGASLRIGLALGAGSAAALAEIGALEVFGESGLVVHSVAGTSAGAIIGAAFAQGQVSAMREGLSGLTRRHVVGLFDPAWTTLGLLRGRRGLEFVHPYLGDTIEALSVPYAAVASDLRSGEEVLLASGSVFDAVRASIAIPGIFTPWRVGGRLLVDGGLVNPVPVSAARALGAQFVIALNVLPLRMAGQAGSLTRSFADRQDDPPTAEDDLGLLEILTRASNILTSQVASGRLREDPPDFLLQIAVPEVGMFDLHRTNELAELGRRAAEAALPEIRAALGRATPLAQRIRSWPGRASAWLGSKS